VLTGQLCPAFPCLFWNTNREHKSSVKTAHHFYIHRTFNYWTQESEFEANGLLLEHKLERNERDLQNCVLTTGYR